MDTLVVHLLNALLYASVLFLIGIGRRGGKPDPVEADEPPALPGAVTPAKA